MAELKTKPTRASVSSFLDGIQDELTSVIERAVPER